MKNTTPLVSCLMVTTARRNRFKRFKQSMACYLHQSYLKRELIIVPDKPTSGNKKRLLNYIRKLHRPDIRVVSIKSKHPLGALRNIAIRNARGRILCQWDDDDLSHPDRIEIQVHALLQQGGGAICLQRILHFFEKSREVFPVNWKRGRASCHAASIAFFKDRRIRYPEKGPAATMAEDVVYLGEYGEKYPVGALSVPANLYVYICHGANTFGGIRDHTRFLANSRKEVLRHKASINRALQCFDFGPGPLHVMSKTGRLYSLHKRRERLSD